VAWLPGNAVDLGTLDTLRAAGTSAAVIDGRTTPLVRPLPFTETGRATVPVRGGTVEAALADPTLSDLLATRTTAPGSALLLSQRLLAETAMITEEHPSDQRTIVLAPPHRWDPDPLVVQTLARALRSTWLRPTGLGALLRTPAKDLRRRPLTYPDTARGQELPTP